jgi:hypothetical protein
MVVPVLLSGTVRKLNRPSEMKGGFFVGEVGTNSPTTLLVFT